jgi:uncharacterized protein YkwD
MSRPARSIRRALVAGAFGLVVSLCAAPAAAASVDNAVAVDVSATAGVEFSGPVATFSSFTANPTSFQATIDWGDGSQETVGDIVVVGFDMEAGTQYRVDGTHTYAAAGAFATTITIEEIEFTPVIVGGTATVSPVVPPPPPPAPPPAPAPPPLVAPAFLSTGFSPRPQVGKLTVLRIRASSPNAPVGGYVVDLGEPNARFGATACSLLAPPPGDPTWPLLAGVPTTFGLSYTFARSGSHAISVVAATGFCTGEQTSATSFTVSVPAASAGGQTAASASWPRLGQLTARAAQTACVDDLTIPGPEQAASSAVCLVNVERARAGLPALAPDARLVTSAGAHGRSMIAGRFFSHQGPGEPDLFRRGAAAGYLDGMGENIGFGTLNFSTASSIVDAWMNSPPHRANILDPRFRGIGISVVPNAPIGPPTPGAAYTANFGTALPAGAPPPPPAGTGPAVKASMAPKAFRAALSGPASSPTGAGARVSYTLTRPANVVFTVQRRGVGRRAGLRCVALTPRNRRAKPCLRTLRLGSFREQGTAGANVLRFRGRINGRRLAPGAYQLVVVATDASRVKSKPRTISFRILRGRP